MKVDAALRCRHDLLFIPVAGFVGLAGGACGYIALQHRGEWWALLSAGMDVALAVGYVWVSTWIARKSGQLYRQGLAMGRAKCLGSAIDAKDNGRSAGEWFDQQVDLLIADSSLFGLDPASFPAPHKAHDESGGRDVSEVADPSATAEVPNK